MKHLVLVATTAVALLGACSAPAQMQQKPTKESRAPEATVRPQDDLFRSVNGAWLESAEIPKDRPSYGAFYALGDKAEEDVHAILEVASKGTNAPGTNAQKVGDLYAAFIDEARVNELGFRPIASELAAIEAIATKKDLVVRLAELQKIGVPG